MSAFRWPFGQANARAADLEAVGGDVRYEVLRSDHGHDGFLIEFDQLHPVLDRFLCEQAKAS
jgi:homoserine acetyltransferase